MSRLRVGATHTWQVMALPQSYTPIIWECDGSNRSFSVTWPFFDGADLVVSCITEAGQVTRLAMPSDFKVKGGKDGNGLPAVGIVETAGIYPAGSSMRIERETKIIQVEALADGPFPSKRIERALDRAMMILEELAFGRSSSGEIRVPANGAAPIVTSTASQSRGDIDVESIARALIKGHADETRAATRDLALHIAALKRQIDGLQSVPSAPVPAVTVPQPQAPVIRTRDQAIVYAMGELNKHAAHHRALIATPGKDLVYAQKQNEARAALDDQEPTAPQRHPETGRDMPKYPHLEAMRGIWVQATANRAEDIRQAAVFVLGRVADFKVASARIERSIEQAKQRIAAASTIEDVLSVPASIVWDIP